MKVVQWEMLANGIPVLSVFSISHSLSMNMSANIKMIVIIFGLILNRVLPVELGSLHPTTQLLLQCVQVLRCHSSN